VEALAARSPAVAEVGILVDVRLVEVDQRVPVTLSALQHRAPLLQEGGPPLRVGAAEPLARLLPRQAQPVQGRADGLAAAKTAEPVPHEADQALERPARRRIGPGYGWAPRDLLDDADGVTEGCLDLWAKGGRPPVRR
jgi:hypothetical protein